ncbi:LRR receptor-like serine/threonine-protein kinase GSO1 [Coffea eugenioides]|uniref:LRR receptor-like serine/threonine-protein kinase GSO1 n=1 Tax=Coffea eugenioides TaxID=49369 RepID=UPI000F606450|nr:LRR receptor-like serine/threonine-protein kinase GSO1 [Coffea eugenioides]
MLFSLENNKIEGSIPRDIGNLTALKELYLGVNNLIVSIGNLSSSIEEIYAGGCKMKERIPKTVGNLSNLSVLGLQENPLPDSNLTSLRYLYLASNRIASHVPDSLWSLKDLLGFILSSNFLTGSLPSEIGLLKVATWIDFSMNQFKNNIPSRIGDLENLNHLSLGQIPSNGPFKNFTSESFISNDALCGSSRFHVPASQTSSIHRSRTKKVLQTKLIVFGASAIIAGVALAFLFVRYVNKEKVPNGTNLFSLTAK